MRLVVLESPYAGDVDLHIRYARLCVRHALSLGEAPIASHLLYTQPGILNDDVASERVFGIEAGHQWMRAADAVLVYTDFGVSNGMRQGIVHAKKYWVPVEYRTLGVSAKDLESNVIPLKVKS